MCSGDAMITKRHEVTPETLPYMRLSLFFHLFKTKDVEKQLLQSFGQVFKMSCAKMQEEKKV